MTGINTEQMGSAALPSPVQWLSTESECTALGKVVGFTCGYMAVTLKEKSCCGYKKHKLETVATKPKTKSN